jgi:hypothetical protein
MMIEQAGTQTNFYQRIQGHGILRRVTSKTPIGRG